METYIESIIDHLKQDYNKLRKHIKGIEDDMINTLMWSSTNLMKILRKIRESVICILN
jgi:hypothetical protein